MAAMKSDICKNIVGKQAVEDANWTDDIQFCYIFRFRNLQVNSVSGYQLLGGLTHGHA
jgi:hypothetical protein